MKTEKEIRQEMEGRRNSIENCKFMAKQTGDKEWNVRAYESAVAMNVLKWVLDEYEMEEEHIIIPTEKLI